MATRDIRIPRKKNGEVSLLIGVDDPEVFWMLDERRGKSSQPYVVKTVLGWSVVGTVKETCNGNCHINFVKKLHELVNQQIECLWRMDKVNAPSSPSQRAMSKKIVMRLTQLKNRNA